MQNALTLTLHLLSLALFLGGQLFYLFIVQPASHSFFSTQEQVRYMQNVLKRQNPILLLALCALAVTGGFLITPLKSQLAGDYYTVFGAKLIEKLGFFFLVFFITVYQSLALGFKIRFVNPAQTDEALKTTLTSLRRQMTVTSIANSALTAYVVTLSKNI